MKRIFLYIISLLAIFLILPVKAQESPDAGEDMPPPEVVLDPGLRIGLNLVRPLMVFPLPSRFGIESVLDYNISPEYFVVAEAGVSRRSLNEPSYKLIERGAFMRIGADRNLYNHYNDVIAIGARLGFSLYERGAPRIFGEDPYWGSITGSLPPSVFFRQWAEVVLVLKTEIFTNILLGWNMRGKLLLPGRDDSHMAEFYIPGFGESSVNATAGFDFYIYYRIPL